jgi:hypothetical protein
MLSNKQGREIMIKLISAIALTIGLAGCVVAPAAPGYGYAYAPAYYAPPTVGVGIGFGGGGCCWHGR